MTEVARTIVPMVTIGEDPHVPLTCFDPSAIPKVKEFKPFTDWISKFKSSPAYVSLGVYIKNIDWIDTRIEGIIVEMELRTKSGVHIKQPISLSLHQAAPTICVIPVISSGDNQSILLCQRRSITNLYLATYTPLYGKFNASNDFEVSEDKFLLTNAGINFARSFLTPLLPGSGTLRSSTEGSTEQFQFYLLNLTDDSGEISRNFPLKSTTPSTAYTLVPVENIDGSLKEEMLLRDSNLYLALLLMRKAEK